MCLLCVAGIMERCDVAQRGGEDAQAAALWRIEPGGTGGQRPARFHRSPFRLLQLT